MIFTVILPGVAEADVRCKWLIAGALGTQFTPSISQVGTFPEFRIDESPPADWEELYAYDVNDATNYSRGRIVSSASSNLANLDATISSRLASADIDLVSGKVNVGQINDATVLGSGSPSDKWRGE